MKYARNVSKMSIGKRILISWLIVAAISFAFGFLVGTARSKEEAGLPGEISDIIQLPIEG